jgi:hypothetical protein
MFSYSNNKLVFTRVRNLERVSEWLGLIGIFSFVISLLRLSWRKWCDPQIDFGRELYIPWRMAEGDKWLKDIDDLYGPLSRFIDAGLFKLFGPGIMVLAWANILIYFGILALLYVLFKRAWGVVAAFSAIFVFVGVFSFSQLVITSNYNFVTPYSQQVTHGFLVSLGLAVLLPGWIEAGTVRRSFWVGLMVGLTAVLKPEFVLASALLLGLAFFYVIKLRGIPNLKVLGACALGGILPTLFFFGLFITYLPLKQAFLAACYAWLNGVFIWKDTLTAHLLNNFSGFDDPQVHLITHLIATGWALAIIGLITIVGLLARYFRFRGIKIVLAVLLALGMAAIGLKVIIWVNVGQCLIGLLTIYGLYRVTQIVRFQRAQFDSRSILRSLLWVLALALMTRMVLNGRIYQYGFIQASLASLVIVAVVVEELPRLLQLKTLELGVFRMGLFVMLLSGVSSIMGQSKTLEVAKTLAIGHGADLFYAYPAQISGDGEIIKNFSDTLIHMPSKQSLVVVPEGIMINYLSRKVSPLAVQAYYTNIKVEEELVAALRVKRPEWVVFMSRDLKEYGVSLYGAKGQSGELIVDWINKNYHVTTSWGQDPKVGVGVGGELYQIK